ncbi:MAG: serine hydrolase [Pseudomonadota bacterium]
MTKLLPFGAISAALALAPAGASLAQNRSVAPQSDQERLDARYDRALAAGYKALFLCSAMANAEANGAARTPESVHEWELTGIYPKLDPIIRDLPYEIVRRPTGQIAHVQVEWAEDAPDRLARYYGRDTGCSVMSIGAPESVSNASAPVPQASDSDTATVKVMEPQSPPKTMNRALDAVLGKAFAQSYGEGRTTAVLVRQLADGEVVLQSALYAPGFTAKTPQRTWSVAKSIASTLVGMAVLSREHAVDDPVGLNVWNSGGAADQRSGITIDHALRMATGRYSDTPGNRTDPIYWGGSTIDEYMTKWPMIHAPGTVFRYANNDTLLAVKAIDQYLYYYTPAALLARIGMTDTVIETDWKGGYVLSSQVWSTAPDLANLGELYLRGGVWDGERLLPEDWRDYVSKPSGPQPEGSPWGYGAGWWLMNRSDGVPSDTFAAFGNRGQYVVVVPSRNVVIVRRGENMVGTRFDIAAFTKDVLAALE